MEEKVKKLTGLPTALYMKSQQKSLRMEDIVDHLNMALDHGHRESSIRFVEVAISDEVRVELAKKGFTVETVRDSMGAIVHFIRWDHVGTETGK